MDISKYIWCFIIGGTICMIGQILIDKTKLTSARILVLFVTFGAILTPFPFPAQGFEIIKILLSIATSAKYANIIIQ